MPCSILKYKFVGIRLFILVLGGWQMKANIFFDTFVDCFNFIVLEYLLVSAMLSFRSNPSYIVFLASNVYIISLFYVRIKKRWGKKLSSLLIISSCFVVLTAFVFYFDYLRMSLPTL